MFLDRRSRTLVLFLLGTMLHPFGTFAQAPLTVTGVSDRQILTDSAAFTVPSTPGHAYSVLLNGQSIPLDVNIVINKADYHEIAISRTNLTSGVVTNRLVKFIIRSSNRGSPETGLIEWLPYPMTDSAAAELAEAQLQLVVPQDYPLGLEIPVAARLEDGQGNAVRANATVTATGRNSVRIRRGIGSGYLAPASAAGTLEYAASVPGLPVTKTINIEETTTWTPVSGTLNGAVVWPDNARISVTGSITVPAGSSLTVQQGAVVRLNAGVELIVRGQLTISGNLQRPVIFTPVTRTQPWGGIITTSAAPARIDATGAFFVGSGANQNWFSGTGYDTHLNQQACFVLDTATGNFTNCFFLDGRGQVGHGDNANLTMVNCIAQRFLTGGEYVGGTIIIDKSAFIEFPADDGIVNPTIANADNDAIYFTTGTHILTDSLFGWCKDDAIDSGSGGAGTVVVSNCWVESALHEALAWSGEGRQTWTYDTVLINSGQGIECGWSTGNNTPLCLADRLLTTGNSIGARYGDNYTQNDGGLGTKNGFLTVTNSFVLHNYRDVFGRPWDNTWDYRAARMDIRSNYISTANSFHPSNTLWNPASHAALLAPFMSTPPDAGVGIAVATWTNQLAMSGIFQGTPIRLSSFTTHPVTVNYTYSTDSETLANGSLTFAPGETVKRIIPAGFDAANRPLIRVTLSNPQGGDLTGLTTVTYVGTVASPTVRIWAAGVQGDIARVVDGLAAVLSIPSGQTVTVGYRFDIDGSTLTSGTLTFAPGQTVAWATPPGSPALTQSLIRFVLSDPVNATLVTPTNVYLFKTVTAEVLPSTALIPRGTVWKYRDLASDPGATWRNTNYNDATWLSGPAELGFSNNEERDEATLIADNNQITSYFRTTFVVSNTVTFTNLSMWMLRDDAGVVHLNGREVYRSPNLPAFPAAIGYSTTSLSGQNGDNTIDTATLSITNLLIGTNWAAVEIHQAAPDSSDVSFNFELLANPLPLPPPGLGLYMASFSEGELTFAWSDATFVLEQTDQFQGAGTIWTAVPGTSPVTITPVSGDPQRFFRLRR